MFAFIEHGAPNTVSGSHPREPCLASASVATTAAAYMHDYILYNLPPHTQSSNVWQWRCGGVAALHNTHQKRAPLVARPCNICPVLNPNQTTKQPINQPTQPYTVAQRAREKHYHAKECVHGTMRARCSVPRYILSGIVSPRHTKPNAHM